MKKSQRRHPTRAFIAYINVNTEEKDKILYINIRQGLHFIITLRLEPYSRVK